MLLSCSHSVLGTLAALHSSFAQTPSYINITADYLLDESFFVVWFLDAEARDEFVVQNTSKRNRVVIVLGGNPFLFEIEHLLCFASASGEVWELFGSAVTDDAAIQHVSVNNRIIPARSRFMVLSC
jgi:hypothetical protein